MLNLFTILVFLFVLLGVLGLRAFTNRARREEMVRERLTELLTQVEEEAKSVAPVEYPDESVLMGLDDYHGHFPKLHARIVRIQKGLELLGWTKNLRLRVLVLGALSFTAAALVGRMTDYPFLIAFFGGAALFASAAALLYLRAMGEWTEDLGKSLPEAIDSIARICRAGVPAQTAFGLAAQNLRGALSEELRTIDRWLRLGVPLKQVLQESAHRVPLPEYRFFAVIVIISYSLQRWWVGKKSYVTVSGKAGGRSSVKGPGPLLSSVIVATVAVVIAFILYLYAIILTGSLVKVWGVNNEITLENYSYVFTHGSKAIKDTLLIACIGTPLGGLLAVLVGYATARLKVRGSRILETVSLLNYTLPGTVVGIAYIIAFNDKPIMLTGTIYILVAAYLFRYSSAGIRNVIAALSQIDPSIEEASRSLGASSVKTFTSITIPLVLPAILAGMRYLFIHSMTAISATIFLVSVHWTLITTRILECMTELQFAQACAFSIVLIVLVFIASGVINLLARALCRSGDAIGVH